IDTMLHLGPRAFEEIGGEVVQSTTFVLRKIYLEAIKSVYIRLVEENSSIEKMNKALEAIKNPNSLNRYSFKQDEFCEIPGSPIAYNVSENFLRLFKGKKFLGDLGEFKTGLIPGNIKKYYRMWT